ncbi:MAG: hypothetical protein HC893_15600, partial [Chloroflexaceae bacterium]|nr:hypothetical protein [Chloroflexaceae bacterium]
HRIRSDIRQSHEMDPDVESGGRGAQGRAHHSPKSTAIEEYRSNPNVAAGAVYELTFPVGLPVLTAIKLEFLPLTFEQQRLWFLDQLGTSRQAYTLAMAFRLRGPLDSTALERSLTTLVQRYSILRTTIVIENGEPVQIIAPTADLPLPQIDLRELPPTPANLPHSSTLPRPSVSHSTWAAAHCCGCGCCTLPTMMLFCCWSCTISLPMAGRLMCWPAT